MKKTHKHKLPAALAQGMGQFGVVAVAGVVLATTVHAQTAAPQTSTARPSAARNTPQSQELRQITTPAGGLAVTDANTLTVYGLIDTSIGYVMQNGKRRTKMESGHMSGSRLGFKGSESLGNGLKANFQLEMGINTTNGESQQNQGFGAKVFGRGTVLSLTGDFGEIRAGRTLASVPTEVQAVGDPFGLGGGGNVQSIQPAPGRQNNNFGYQTPKIGGFIGKLSYTFGEHTGRDIDTKRRADQYSIALFYYQDAVSGAISFTQMKNPSDDSNVRYINSALAYDFKSFKLFGTLASFKNPGAAITPTVNTALNNTGQLAGFPSVGYYSGQDLLSYSIGASIKLGPGNLLVNAIVVDDSGPLHRDAKQFGIAYLYPLSKRTSLYADYGMIRNKNGAGYALIGAVSAAGFSNSGNSDALRFGIRHAF